MSLNAFGNALGISLQLDIPHDVFSTLRIDEGTKLLLDHLPQEEPTSVLDMGCGYGALGLPIAARFPEAQVDLVGRDLLAVHWAAENAQKNNLKNVRVLGSLGFRDLTEKVERDKKYDWILCNVPARIGRSFIKHLVEEGCARLAPHGTLRLVVIRDLAPVIEEVSKGFSGSLTEIARGPRHVVFGIQPDSGARSNSNITLSVPDLETLYLRDTVSVGGLELERPFDLGGDDPQRLSKGLPLLFDALPRQAPSQVLCFRCGYGALPLFSLVKWPQAHVLATDRDLLATTFTRRNAQRLSLQSDRLSVREGVSLNETLKYGESFDLVIGELSPSAGERVAKSELEAIARSLKPGGQALILALDKLVKEWVKPSKVPSGGVSVHTLMSREGYTVLFMS